ncbi:FAD-binding oxidoreductase [Pseudonocardia kujensis]|uniref:FAD-binding and (Fe-S)-binding domain-containing protein n=1 Tax=Pseudonocardia kujensis TaxID=1128675 RepID=UPI001E4C5F24|nr:FAD-binding and (Fe-S)-binding domain-containing protein [Pseudonocardia kujensis]MCE0767377.1 FAD-binding oxidoreductase [Pseudonocardia kujensis]
MPTTTELRTRLVDRLAWSRDASHFALVPQAVAVPADAAAVGSLFADAALTGVPLTFRSGGTSLSGQAGTEGILVDTRRHFRGIEVLDDGARVRTGPGATVRQVNARLAPYGRKIGPDPASESACTLGGVVANNSSGMACGTTANSYATLDSLVLVLPSGTVLDTAAPDADARLRALEPELHAGLARLRDRVRDDPALRTRVEQQFAMKNTMGYGLNSLLDHTRPADVLAHLVVGSEGTLAFIASIVLRTVPLLPHARTGLLVFSDLAGATGALPEIVDTGATTIELLDATSLRVGQADPQADAALRALEVDRHAALLVEYQAATAQEADDLAGAATGVLGTLPVSGPRSLAADPAARAALWHIRKGLYATVAGARPTGTTALLEDVVVPVPALLPTCESLSRLFDKHEYDHAVIFGHAKDGNIHFMLTERLGGDVPLDRFARFTDDMVDLVLGHGGSLKAEHGTGRMMAPFVRRQYGDELYEVMREIKRLCDPRGVLNPGVLIDEDPEGHLRHLKSAPAVEEEVDRCVECGFCEPVCPSRDLTTTPRQRIVLRREMQRAREAGDTAVLAELERDYEYAGIDTCAADGMCQTACPVLINTGDLVKRLRAEQAGPLAQRGWAVAAKHWAGTTRAAAGALTAADALPDRLVAGATALGRRVVDPEVLPAWSPELPRGGRPRSDTARPRADAVLFASCTGTMFGPAGDDRSGERGAAAAFERLCARGGVTLTRPAGLASLCCGTPWKSKGLTAGYAEMARRVLPALWEASRGGELPVIGDASSCTEGLRQLVADATDRRYAAIRVVDAVAFTAERLLDRLTVTPLDSLALHPTCSAVRMGLDGPLRAVAAAVARTVTVPATWGCCGFAGDRGLLHPELTAAATAPQATELAGRTFDAHASCNRTCELGMTRATGRPYEHVLEVLDRVSAASVPAAP